MSSNIIYLDNNATTCVAPEVFEAMTPYLTEFYGNPSSIHRFGGQLAAKVEEARAQLGALIGAQNSEIIFTSCGTESDTTAIRSALSICPKRRKVVISKVEHPAVLNLGKELERNGYKVSIIPVDARGRLDMDRAREMIDSETAVVSVMWANNETGNIQPVIELGELARKNGALFHTDAVQAVGKVPMNLAELPIDMLSLSGHKFHAPKGIGALYVKRGVRFHPYIIGGHQEHGRRAGTENLASIVGLGKAAELALANIGHENTAVRALRDKLEQGVLASIPSVRINGDVEHRLPNTANISFEYIEGESILMLLDMHNICASSGSACTTGSLEPSHVLRAMGVPYTAAHGSIRFSFSRYNTEAEVDRVLEVLPPVIARLREISPYWKQQQN
ncbi:MAG: cysteine desulfurase NifS [Lentisphaeria bacterium]|nr:cysteine desulfurase NifS [Lentisphaerota bacterium]MBO5695061.1 cysteine desulfurase NifS [Lentisphaeria bacterium]MBO5802539.1 cysteine desulfurase NifS [Lentisphaeria bacterium]MBR4883757.1 cysteine desulfurase NifS [Lentisphaeria bacterium]